MLLSLYGVSIWVVSVQVQLFHCGSEDQQQGVVSLDFLRRALSQSKTCKSYWFYKLDVLVSTCFFEVAHLLLLKLEWVFVGLYVHTVDTEPLHEPHRPVNSGWCAARPTTQMCVFMWLFKQKRHVRNIMTCFVWCVWLFCQQFRSGQALTLCSVFRGFWAGQVDVSFSVSSLFRIGSCWDKMLLWTIRLWLFCMFRIERHAPLYNIYILHIL